MKFDHRLSARPPDVNQPLNSSGAVLHRVPAHLQSAQFAPTFVEGCFSPRVAVLETSLSAHRNRSERTPYDATFFEEAVRAVPVAEIEVLPGHPLARGSGLYRVSVDKQLDGAYVAREIARVRVGFRECSRRNPAW